MHKKAYCTAKYDEVIDKIESQIFKFDSFKEIIDNKNWKKPFKRARELYSLDYDDYHSVKALLLTEIQNTN